MCYSALTTREGSTSTTSRVGAEDDPEIEPGLIEPGTLEADPSAPAGG